MPYNIDPEDQRSAASELVEAAVSGIGVGMMTPLGWGLAKGILKTGWSATKEAAYLGVDVARGAGTMARWAWTGATKYTPTFTSATAGFLGGAAYGMGRGVAGLGWGLAKTAAIGGIDTAYRLGRFAWNHPYVSATGGAALGFGLAAGFTAPPPAEAVGVSGPMDAMNGPGAMMDNMNASGDLVLGLHRRR